MIQIAAEPMYNPHEVGVCRAAGGGISCRLWGDLRAPTAKHRTIAGPRDERRGRPLLTNQHIWTKLQSSPYAAPRFVLNEIDPEYLFPRTGPLPPKLSTRYLLANAWNGMRCLMLTPRSFVPLPGHSPPFPPSQERKKDRHHFIAPA